MMQRTWGQSNAHGDTLTNFAHVCTCRIDHAVLPRSLYTGGQCGGDFQEWLVCVPTLDTCPLPAHMTSSGIPQTLGQLLQLTGLSDGDVPEHKQKHAGQKANCECCDVHAQWFMRLSFGSAGFMASGPKDNEVGVTTKNGQRPLTPFEAQIAHGMPPVDHMHETPGLTNAQHHQVVGNGWSVLVTSSIFSTLPPQVARLKVSLAGQW
jgi:hypothetical protein